MRRATAILAGLWVLGGCVSAPPTGGGGGIPAPTAPASTPSGGAGSDPTPSPAPQPSSLPSALPTEQPASYPTLPPRAVERVRFDDALAFGALEGYGPERAIDGDLDTDWKSDPMALGHGGRSAWDLDLSGGRTPIHGLLVKAMPGQRFEVRRLIGGNPTDYIVLGTFKTSSYREEWCEFSQLTYPDYLRIACQNAPNNGSAILFEVTGVRFIGP